MNLSPPQCQQLPRRAPSMPPMRWQPRLVCPSRTVCMTFTDVSQPVMPQPLAPGRPGSEPGVAQRPKRDQLAAMYGRDLAAALTDRLADPRNAYEVSNTHNMFVPPQQTPRAVSVGIEGVQRPRHSALGLEGLGFDARGSAGIEPRVSSAGEVDSELMTSLDQITVQPPVG